MSALTSSCATEDSITQLIRLQLQSALVECCPPREALALVKGQALLRVAVELQEDAENFALKDPAAAGDAISVIQSYTSFKALMHYRLARALLEERALVHERRAETYAALVSSRGKLLSGAELHHRCRIGRRFVLDHGMGTVIGETACIGDDCYVLGGVTLGARGVAGNPAGKRHPTVGDHVQIGAFARIFGDVTIGDHAFIGPHCVITEDVPPGVSVTVRTTLQVTKAPSRVRACASSADPVVP